jgi:S1/P1 Nuclease
VPDSGGNRPLPGPGLQPKYWLRRYGHAQILALHRHAFTIDRTPTEDPSTTNAQTEIALFRKTLASPVATDDVKSYDLAWLLHLVGDIHQPLHATSGFSVSEPHGDNGGNNEKITCRGCAETALHWFWDDAPGVSDNPDDAIAAAKTLPVPDLRQAAVRDENVWIDESFELAKQVVYQPPVFVGPGSRPAGASG